MSSPKTAKRAKGVAHAAEPPAVAGSDVAAQEMAQALAAAIQRGLAAGDPSVLSPEALQKLMTATCRLYSAQVEAGSQVAPVREVTSTDIMTTASGLLKAGNLAVFELGMWQSWTGR